jgi:hypothetical protein
VGKPEEKRPLGRPRRRWVMNNGNVEKSETVVGETFSFI